MPIYSHSRLATFENCPQQFKLRYIDKVRIEGGEEEGIEAFLGTRVHEVLEKLYKELVLSKRNSVEDLLGFYNEIWKKNWHKHVVIVRKGFTKDHYKQAGIEAIQNYYQKHLPFNQSKTLSTEALVTFKLGDYSIQGYIDRVAYLGKGCYEIHDYKTSGTLPPDQKFDTDRQLALYQIGIRQKYRDAKEIKLVWHYLLFNREITSTRTERQLDDLKKEVIALIKKIERETKFSPNESKLCDWCEYPDFCPAKKHEAKVATLTVNKYLKDKGVTLVNKYADIKAKIAELKAQEKELAEELTLLDEAAMKYAEKEGITNITGRDFLLRVIESEFLSFPRAGAKERVKLEALLKKIRVWNEVSTLSLSKLGKLVESDEIPAGQSKQIMKFAETGTDCSVRLVKKKEEE